MRSRTIWITTLLAVLCTLAAAQSPGILPFSTHEYGIDLASGAVLLNFPLLAKPGKIPYSSNLIANNFYYPFVATEPSGVGTYIAWGLSGGAAFNDTVVQARIQASVTVNECPQTTDGVFYAYTASAVIDGTGAAHSIGDPITWNRASNAQCQAEESAQAVAGTAIDHSGWTLYVPTTGNPLVYDASGHQYTIAGVGGGYATTFTDPDGSAISWNTSDPEVGGSVTDTLGTTALTTAEVLNSSGQLTSMSYSYYNDQIGDTESYTVTYNPAILLRSNFACANGGFTIAEFAGANMPTSIQSPTGASYTISYEPTPSGNGFTNTSPPTYFTGRIAQITLPSGGSISYTYTGGNNGVYCPSNSGETAYVPTITVTVNDANGHSGVYTYVHSTVSSSGTFTVTKTDPVGNQTVYTLSGEFQTEVQYYQGSATGTPLKTVTTKYNENSTNTAALPVTETDVYTSLNGSASSRVITTYDAHSNVTSVLTYDFGGALLSSAYNYYGQSWNGSACTTYPATTGPAAYIFNTPCYSYVTNAAGTIVAKAEITYSNTGHAVTTAKWVSGSKWLTSTATYNSNGTIATTNDVNGTLYTFGYNGTDGCNSVLPTSLVITGTGLPSAGLSGSAEWDCDGGVPTGTTDPNGETTIYSYGDPSYRLTNVGYPDNGATTIAYSTGSTLPWTITTAKATQMVPNPACKIVACNIHNRSIPGDYVTNVAVYDGLDRVVQKQNTSDPSGTDYTATTYNNLGQVVSVSQPYRSGATVYTTQYSYDALNRVTKVVTPNNNSKITTYSGRATELQQFPAYSNQITISQINGLGQTVEVCDVTTLTQKGSTGTPAACGLDIADTGFLTSYSFDPLGNILNVSNATNTRTFTYDGLSRLTQAVEPELSMNAVNYTYDTLTAGDLYQRTAPAPNQTSTATVTTTYLHDGLHRLTEQSYNDGATPTVMLTYDQSSLWGETLTNPLGRLTERYTCAVGTSCTVTTADGFSYDAMGRVLYDYQCTPSTCGTTTFPGTYTYNLLGQITTGNDVEGGITFTNTYNAAAQLTEISTNYLSSSESGNVVSGILYNAAGQPTSETLGNGITESWTYDAANNQSSYTAGTVYSNSISWVGNELAVSSTDSVNGDWSYGFDNFARMNTSSCSSSTSVCPGGQSSVGFGYAYDQLGNRWAQGLTKGSGPTPQFTFNSYNHISTGGYAYDAAGNMTNDTFHTYTYDAEGRMTKVDGGSTAFFVYNGAGYRVEQGGLGLASADYLYDLNGNEVTLFVPGTTNVYSSELFDNGKHWLTFNGEAQFLHADWVGNVRVVTNLAGTTDEECTNMPFGDGLACQLNAITNYVGLGGAFWDGWDNLSHSPARQYSGTEGRWLAADPAGMAAADPTNPQSWNRYAYVNNNPSSRMDPTGLGWTPPTGGPPTQTLVNDLMGAKCGAWAAYSGWVGNMPCALFMAGGCAIDGVEGNCTAAFNALHDDEFEVMNIAFQTANNASPQISYDYQWVPSGNTSTTAFDPYGGQMLSYSDTSGGYWQYSGMTYTYSTGGGGASWLLIGGVLPPGMNGGYWAAKQATRGWPKTNLPPTENPIWPEAQGPDLGGWDEEAIKILEMAAHGLMEMREVQIAPMVMPKVQSCMILQNCGPEL